MKKLYKELFFVIGIFLMIVSLIEWRLSDFKAPIDKLFATQKKNATANILIVGNSHTGALQETTDSFFIKNSNNLSLANLELMDRYKVIKYCIENGRIDKIILGLDADQIGHQVSSTNYDMQMSRYGIEMYNNTAGNKLLSKLNSFRLHLNIKDLCKNVLSGKDTDTAKINFIPFTNKKKNDMEACVKRAQEHAIYIYQTKNIKENMQILQDIIDLCKTNKVQLFFLQTPKPACYTAAFSTAQMQAATTAIDSVANENGVKYLNYLHNTLFNENDFVDFDHLGANGSNKLIELLKKEL